MHIVRRDEFQIEIARDANQFGIDLGELGNAVLLQFDVKAVLENLAIPVHQIARLLDVALEQHLRNFRAHAARRRNHALRKFFERLFVNARLLIKTFELRERRNFQKIFIARFVFGEQQKMIRRTVEFAVAVAHAARREVTLDADDRFHAVVFARVMKFNCREHGAVVGDSNGGHAIFFGARGKSFGTRQTIEQRVFGMNVEVDEFSHSSRCRVAEIRVE